MTNYYILENGIITQSANFKFDENCLETQQQIVRANNGQLMLQSDYNNYINTQQYKLKQFQDSIQYQHDAFDEFSSVINNQIKTLENLHAANVRAENTSEAERLKALIDGLQDDLLAEQQAVIARINQLTEDYNNAST